MATDSEGKVLFVREGSTAVVTLNRPERLNALNRDLVFELEDALQRASTSRAIVLRGAGRAFCSGEDLVDGLGVEGDGGSGLRQALMALQRITRTLVSFPGSVVAAVAGYAVGGGAELALAADLVICAPDAKFRFPEVPLGYAHTGGVTQRLTAIVGLARAKELLLTGRWVAADEARSIGMVAEVVVDANARALELAAQLASHPRRSVEAAKRSVELAGGSVLEEALYREVDAAMWCFASAEAEASFREFRDRSRSQSVDDA